MNQTETKKSNVNIVIGLFMIAVAVVTALFVKCPTKIQYFVIYALVGLGIALLLFRSAEQSTFTMRVWNIGVGLTGGVALPFILFFTNPVGKFKTDACAIRRNITVFVHGKKGRQDMILRQKGFVMMDLGGERKRSSINENGQAFFQNLNTGDSTRIDIDFSEPYKTLYPDSVYYIGESDVIYLPVSLQGIGFVKGMVLYNESPLGGVIVKLIGKTENLLDTTNQTGDFSFRIPENNQLNDYQVWFMKDSFKTKSAPAYPQTGEPLNIVMEKK